MKITKRQLRRIIKESLNEIGPPPDMSDPDWHPNMSQEWESRAQSEERMQDVADDVFIKALRDTWNSVRIDVDIPNPTWEDKADEVTAMLSTYHPDLAKEFDTRSFKEQDMLLRLAFDPSF